MQTSVISELETLSIVEHSSHSTSCNPASPRSNLLLIAFTSRYPIGFRRSLRTLPSV